MKTSELPVTGDAQFPAKSHGVGAPATSYENAVRIFIG